MSSVGLDRPRPTAALAAARAHGFARRIPTWLLGAGVAASTWPLATLAPSEIPGYFTVGLHLAAADGLHFGSDVVFTYGPLAFLTFPSLVTTWTAVAAFAYALVAHGALAYVVLRVCLDSSSRPVAALAACAAAALPLPLADVPVLLVFAGAVWTIERRRSVGLPAATAGGLLCAFELLVKLNDGLLCVALVVVATACGTHRLRTLGVALASFLGGTVLLWLATGNRIADLPAWLRLSAHLVASYTQGMQLGPGITRDVVAAAAIGAAWAVLTLLGGRGLPRRRVAGLLLCVALIAFAYFKEGFVRHDSWHVSVLFAALAVAILVVPLPTQLLRVWGLLLAAAAAGQLRGDDLAVTLLLLAAAWLLASEARLRSRRALTLVLPAGAAVAVSLAAVTLSPNATVLALSRFPGLGALADQARTLAEPGARRAVLAAYRAEWRARYRLSPAALAALRGRSVSVEPWGAPLAWAYGLEWRPEPLLESYAAYDRALDTFAAHRLAVAGPDRILEWSPWTAIDSHHPAWQAPALALAVVCNYRTAVRAGGFTVLRRAPGRCGTPRPLGTATAGAGEWIRVPHARGGQIVVASLRLDLGLRQRLRSLLSRPRTVWVDVPGRRYALVPGVAGDRLLLRLPARPGLPQPGRGLPVQRFRVTGVRDVRVTFSSLPVR